MTNETYIIVTTLAWALLGTAGCVYLVMKNETLSEKLDDQQRRADICEKNCDEATNALYQLDEEREPLRKALVFYEQQVSNCNKTDADGETARDRLAKDHGQRARAVLNKETHANS